MLNFKKIRKFSINLKPVLHNKLVLYSVVLIAFLDVMYMLQINDFASVMIFLLSGFVTTFFSKNMMVILFVALIVSHIGRYGMRIGENMKNKETMENKEEPEDGKDENEEENNKEEDNKEEKKEKTGDELVDEMINNMSEEDKNELLEKKEEVEKDVSELAKMQETMISKVEVLEPILDKAENFMKKYGKYIKFNEKFSGR